LVCTEATELVAFMPFIVNTSHIVHIS